MGSKQKKPNQINYLNRRLLGSTVIGLFVFTVAFMLLFVLFDNTISNQLGTWIADNTELVAYLAHDIRTPLTSVIGYLQLLSEDDNVDEEKVLSRGQRTVHLKRRGGSRSRHCS